MMNTPSHNGGSIPAARLMITKMVLENFKSYAGVQEIGPFHKRFSSIVGPNGSGKSNVIDALLFVFGKRAKQLRLNKVSELIHKSSKYPNLEFARVAIHFQLIHDIESSEDDFEVVPGSEFTVTRVATLNNQSKYTVDGKNSTYTEVGVLLRKYGIDLDNNRFLILQGEVEQIAMMKPKAQTPHEDGLLEYLEDIIGSNKYVERINEAQKVVEEFNELRVEKVKRLQLTQNEKDNLEGPRAEAAAYLEKEAELRERLNLLYQMYIQEAAKNVAEINAKKEKSQERLMYERTKLAETEARLGSIEGEYTSTNKEYDALVEEMQRTAEEFTAFERRDTKLIEDMKHIKAQIAKLQSTLNKEIKKEADFHAETSTTQQKINALKESQSITMTRRSEAEAHLDTVMDGLREATAALRQELEVALTELSAADRSVAALQTEKESITTSVELAQSRAQSAQKSLMQQEDRLGLLRAEKLTTEKSKVQAEKSLSSSRKKVDGNNADLSSLRQIEQTLQTKIRSAITELEEAKAQSQQSDTVSRAEIAAIMNQTRKGGILANAGVHGRLGDLGSIAAEHDVAVSTACGMLDYIVVDNTEGAQACVAYLREHNVGRASFIVLDKQPDFTSKMDNPPPLPPNTPRLFDLITPKNPIYRPAFYSAVKDTLVATNLDTAVKIAYEGDRVKWRVVTSDGNLIDTSGAMSGGGKTAKSGGMRPTKEAKSSDAETTKREMERLEGVVATLQGELDACRRSISQLENEVQSESQNIKKLTVEVEKCAVALNQISIDMTDASDRIAALRSETTITAAEEQKIQQLQKKLAQITAQMDAVSPNRNNIQQQVQTIQQQILDVGGPKLKRAQASVDNLSNELDTITRDLASAEAQHQNSIKQAAKSATAKAKAEKDLEKSLQKKQELEAEQKDMEKDAEKVLIAQAQAKKAAEEKEAFLKTITGEYKSLKELVAKIRNVEVDLTSAVDEFNKAIKENESKKKHWEDKLEEVRRTHASEMQEQAKWSPAPQEAIERKEDDMEIDAPAVGILPIFSSEELEKQRGLETIKREINVLEAERDKLKGSVNMTALAEYRKKDIEYRERMGELEEVTDKRNTARKAHDELRRQRLEEFMSGFGVITLKLKEMYQMITLGGDAELELVDSLDPFSEGIVFSVRPPKKSWKNISNLSGGEKTLSSLALVFALHHYKPTPLYVMDEIDAALDFKNVSIVANYIKERTKNAQFVIISLRNNMFELADRLVGIYKTNDATKSVTINPRAFADAVEGKRPPNQDENSVRKVNILADSTNFMGNESFYYVE